MPKFIMPRHVFLGVLTFEEFEDVCVWQLFDSKREMIVGCVGNHYSCIVLPTHLNVREQPFDFYGEGRYFEKKVWF